jgi:mxaD protein
MKPPAELKVTESVEIAAPPRVVWQKVRDFDGIAGWHPAFASSPIVEGVNNQKGAVRVLSLRDGGTIREELIAHDDAGHSLTYRILEGVLPVSAYVSTIKVESAASGRSVVEWQGTFKRKSPADPPPAGEDDLTATSTITGAYQAGLANLKQILEAK